MFYFILFIIQGHELSLHKGRACKVNIAHGEDEGFYSSGVRVSEWEIRQQIGVTEAEHKCTSLS